MEDHLQAAPIRKHYAPPPRRSSWRIFQILFPLGILVVVLLVVLFRFVLTAQRARVTHNSVQVLRDLEGSSNQTNSSSSSLFIVRADLGILNPNLAATFDYYNGSFDLLLEDELVDHMPLPSGFLQPQRSTNFTAVLRLNASTSSRKNTVPITTHARMIGYVHKWAFFKHHFNLSTICHARIVLAAPSSEFDCTGA